MSGKGDAGVSGAAAGDLYINVFVKPDKHFQRQGDDLLTALIIPFTEAVLGGEELVRTIDGEVKLKFRLVPKLVSRLFCVIKVCIS